MDANLLLVDLPIDWFGRCFQDETEKQMQIDGNSSNSVWNNRKIKKKEEKIEKESVILIERDEREAGGKERFGWERISG